jgi:hypothetical protein
MMRPAEPSPDPGAEAAEPVDLRPFTVAAATAVVTMSLLLAAARWGWLGPDVGRGSGFCEEAHVGWIKQPVNSWSNLGFVAAGLAVGWQARHPARLGRTMGANPKLATVFAVVMVLLGPASMAMHATQTSLGGRLDTLSMYFIASFAAMYAAMRLFRRGPAFLVPAFVLTVIACEVVENVGGEVPLVMSAGNLAFGGLLIAAFVMELILKTRGGQDLVWGMSAVGTMVTAFAIWTVSKTGHPWCDPASLLQGHGVWHLLCALGGYLLFRHYIAERGAPEPVSGSRSPARQPARRG